MTNKELKLWKEFTQYRTDTLIKWYRSKEYRDIQEKRSRMFSPIKSKFLFWETETLPDPYWQMYELNRLTLLESLQKPYIPDETYENFLTWCVENKK